MQKGITLDIDTSEANAKIDALRAEVERIDALMSAVLNKADAARAWLGEGGLVRKADVVAWLKSVGAVGAASELERSAGIPWEPPKPPPPPPG